MTMCRGRVKLVYRLQVVLLDVTPGSLVVAFEVQPNRGNLGLSMAEAMRMVDDLTAQKIPLSLGNYTVIDSELPYYQKDKEISVGFVLIIVFSVAMMCGLLVGGCLALRRHRLLQVWIFSLILFHTCCSLVTSKKNVQGREHLKEATQIDWSSIHVEKGHKLLTIQFGNVLN